MSDSIISMAVNPPTIMPKNLLLAHLKSYLPGLVRDTTLETQVYYILLN